LPLNKTLDLRRSQAQLELHHASLIQAVKNGELKRGEGMKNMNSRLKGVRNLEHTEGRRLFYFAPMRLAILCLLASTGFPLVSRAQAPVFKITQEDSSIKFFVKASVALEGTFEKWDATVTFTSPDLTTGVLDIKIQADSVKTGSGMKDGKLKGKTSLTSKTIR
jgi:hypothetical protein